MEFIYDRTEDDVYEAQRFEQMDWKDFSDDEKEQWFAGLKGAFNYTVWNRIVSNILALDQEIYGTKVEWEANPYSENAQSKNFTSKEFIILNPEKYTLVIVPFLNPTGPPETSDIITIHDEYYYYYTTEKDYDHIYISTSAPFNDLNSNTKIILMDNVIHSSFTSIVKSMSSIFKYNDFQELFDNTTRQIARIPHFDTDLETGSEIVSDYKFINMIERRTWNCYNFANAKNEYIVPTTWLNGYTVDKTTGEVIETEEDVYMADGKYNYYKFTNNTPNGTVSKIKVPQGTVAEIFFYLNGLIYSRYERYVADENGIEFELDLPYHARIVIYGTKGKIVAFK